MLPPFIIEQIKKREERVHEEQVQLEIEIPRQPRPKTEAPTGSDDVDRGVLILEL